MFESKRPIFNVFTKNHIYKYKKATGDILKDKKAMSYNYKFPVCCGIGNIKSNKRTIKPHPIRVRVIFCKGSYHWGNIGEEYCKVSSYNGFEK